MKKLRVADPAVRDLDAIWAYVVRESGSIAVADSLVDRITATFKILVRNPEAGTRRDELSSGLRAFPMANYIVYYRVAQRHILISRIIHGMRDQRAALLGSN